MLVTVGTREGGAMEKGNYYVVATQYETGRPNAIFAAKRPNGPYAGETVLAGPFPTLEQGIIAENVLWDELVLTDSDGYAQWR